MFKRTLPRYAEWPHNHVYLELHAHSTERRLDNPRIETNDDYDDLWGMIVRDACVDFQERTGVEVYLLGRSNRHVCVEDSPENSRRYQYLRRIALELEQVAIDAFNSAVPA
jgi:hypothetical protein